MKPRTLAGALVIAWLVGLGIDAKAAPYCPITALPSRSGCASDQNSSPIPSGLGGQLIARNACDAVVVASYASLYVYSDASCHQSNDNVVSGALTFIGDALDYLGPDEKDKAQRANFHGSLYCDVETKTMILAFRGSVSVTELASERGLQDWFQTNFAQQFGKRPSQYEVAADAAWQVYDRLKNSDFFKGRCGTDRPSFVLTGHSKGGGQAQYAAVRNQLDAVVFNAAPVNEAIFSDWILTSYLPAILALPVATLRTWLSCHGSPRDNSFARYFGTGRIRDVRMVNDAIALYLMPVCSFPHAQIEWIRDSFSCSRGGFLTGHYIETVVRELNPCEH